MPILSGTLRLDREGDGFSKRRKEIIVLFIPLIVLLIMRETFMGRTALLTKVPAIFIVPAIAIGLAIGIRITYLIARSADTGQTFRLVVLGLTFVFGTPFLTSYLARTGFEVAVFASDSAPTFPIEVAVTAVGTRRSWADVRAYQNGRDVKINVTRELFSILDPHRNPGRDCILIVAQKGQSGAVRAIIPSLFDTGISIDRLRPCPASVRRWVS